MDTTWPAPAEALGPVSVATVLWRWAGQLNATIVVKACFAIQPDAPMRVAAPEPLRMLDQHAGDVPGRSIVGARELAPQLRKADVTLVGHAYAPPGGARQITARLALSRDGRTLLDKSVYVYGDRGAGGEPQPFERMNLDYERALGGIGYLDNPLGVGTADSAERQPNVVAPDGPTTHVACFAPVPSTFPRRRRRLGKVSRRAIEGLVVEIPDHFDWQYFQAAPDDQQLDSLRGDEWLALDGLHPAAQSVRTRLPGLKGWARVLGHDRIGAPDVVPLAADTLLIQPDRNCCSIVWRGGFPLPDEQAAQALLVVATLAHVGQTVAWPSHLQPPRVGSRAAPRAPESPPSSSAALGTTVLSPADQSDAARHEATPFRSVPHAAPESERPVLPLPGAPWSTESLPDVPVPVEGDSETMQIDLSTAGDAVLQAQAAAAAALGVAGSAIPRPPPVVHDTDADEAVRWARDAERRAALEAASSAPRSERRLEEEARQVSRREAAAKAAEERARVEAEARRTADEERARIEAEAQQRAAQAREQAEQRAKQQAAKVLKSNLYGGFRRKS